MRIVRGYDKASFVRYDLIALTWVLNSSLPLADERFSSTATRPYLESERPSSDHLSVLYRYPEILYHVRDAGSRLNCLTHVPWEHTIEDRWVFYMIAILVSSILSHGTLSRMSVRTGLKDYKLNKVKWGKPFHKCAKKSIWIYKKNFQKPYWGCDNCTNLKVVQILRHFLLNNDGFAIKS